jgi:hypothetical protein
VSENKPPEEPATSGSRWEDSSNEEPNAQAVEESAAATTAAEPAAEPKSRRFAWLGGRAALIGGALALALVTGLAGFGIGHALSDGDDDRMGDRGWHHHDGDDGERRPGMNPGERPDFNQERGSDSEGSTQG